ncbi:hypothetical protein JCM5296_006962 [Sporobolomyces johnsonii]
MVYTQLSLSSPINQFHTYPSYFVHLPSDHLLYAITTTTLELSKPSARSSPRFDPVLMRNHKFPLSYGYRAVNVARLQLLFSIDLVGCEVQLALVDRYIKVSTVAAKVVGQPTVKLAQLPDGSPQREVIPVGDVL